MKLQFPFGADFQIGLLFQIGLYWAFFWLGGIFTGAINTNWRTRTCTNFMCTVATNVTCNAGFSPCLCMGKVLAPKHALGWRCKAATANPMITESNAHMHKRWCL